VTGFGPFSDVLHNPSSILARESGHPFEVLEVSYRAADQFIEGISTSDYDFVLLMGVARGRSQLCPELLARNAKSGVDIEGVDSTGPIEVGAPEVLSSGLWTRRLLELIKSRHPDKLIASEDAGRYLCNYLYYRALRKLTTVPVGFLHVVATEVVSIANQQLILRDILGELSVQ
jgi:pyroglutamyl-peptidase